MTLKHCLELVLTLSSSSHYSVTRQPRLKGSHRFSFPWRRDGAFTQSGTKTLAGGRECQPQSKTSRARAKCNNFDYRILSQRASPDSDTCIQLTQFPEERNDESDHLKMFEQVVCAQLRRQAAKKRGC